MSNQISTEFDRTASRIATAGIILGLVLTTAGMMLRSPVLGAIGLAGVPLAVLFRRPLARLVPRR